MLHHSLECSQKRSKTMAYQVKVRFYLMSSSYKTVYTLYFAHTTIIILNLFFLIWRKKNERIRTLYNLFYQTDVSKLNVIFKFMGKWEGWRGVQEITRRNRSYWSLIVIETDKHC
jgi:hypothetical protein